MSNESKTYISEVKEILEDGSAVLGLPDELLNDMGWKEGDTLDIKLEDGAIILKKID